MDYDALSFDAKKSIEIGYRQCIDGIEAKVGRSLTEAEKLFVKYGFAAGGAHAGRTLQILMAPIIK